METPVSILAVLIRVIVAAIPAALVTLEMAASVTPVTRLCDTGIEA